MNFIERSFVMSDHELAAGFGNFVVSLATDNIRLLEFEKFLLKWYIVGIYMDKNTNGSILKPTDRYHNILLKIPLIELVSKVAQTSKRVGLSKIDELDDLVHIISLRDGKDLTPVKRLANLVTAVLFDDKYEIRDDHGYNMMKVMMRKIIINWAEKNDRPMIT